MKKLILLSLFSYILFSCSTDKLNVIEDAIEDTIEDPEEKMASDETPEGIPEDTTHDENQADYFIDRFDTDGALIDYITNNASALPDVTSVSGRYKATLVDNTNNITLRFKKRPSYGKVFF